MYFFQNLWAKFFKRINHSSQHINICNNFGGITVFWIRKN